MAAAKRSAALARSASRTAGSAPSPAGSSARPRRRAIRSRPALTKYRSLPRSSASMLVGRFTSLDRLIEPERHQEARGTLPTVLPGIGPSKAEFVHGKAAVDRHRPDVFRAIAVLEARRDHRRGAGFPGELHVDQRIVLPDLS